MMIDFNDIGVILDESNRTYKKDILDFDAVGEKLLNESSNKVPKITYQTIEDALYQWYIYQLDFNSNFSDERTKEAYDDIFNIIKESKGPTFGLINEIIHKIEWYGYDSWQFKSNIYDLINE